MFHEFIGVLARFSNFHEYLWVYIDEVDEERLGDTATSSSLKKLIANATVPKEAKGIQSHKGNNEAPNNVTLMMMCNRVPHQVINGRDGRRFEFYDVSATRANDLKYFGDYTKRLETPIEGQGTEVEGQDLIYPMHVFSRWLVFSPEVIQYRKEVFETTTGNIAGINPFNTKCRLQCLKGFDKWLYHILHTGQIEGVKKDLLEVQPDWTSALLPPWLESEWKQYYGNCSGNLCAAIQDGASEDAKKGWPLICNLNNLFVAFQCYKDREVKKVDFATFQNMIEQFLPQQNWVKIFMCPDRRMKYSVMCIHMPSRGIMRYAFCQEFRFEVTTVFPDEWDSSFFT